ncbi:MAG TPA: cation:proton antiporter, partial [Solirubrobacteraceae bacterium]|nr:cation:proton antiporter [Solirubrobacteraceae bacterium]
GILGGAGAGLLVAAVVRIGRREGLIADSWLRVVPVAGAALSYGVAAALGGSGFIAAFLAGMLFGALVHESDEASRFSDTLGELLDGVTFLAFGAVLLGPALAHLSWSIFGYAVLSLTVVRILPVAIAMIGTGASRPTVAFLGWFGPRGLASIVFAVIVVEQSQLPHVQTILLTTYVTVGLSVFAHGLSAVPLADRYAKWYRSHPRDRVPTMESAPAATHRSRGSIAPAPQETVGAQS